MSNIVLKFPVHKMETGYITIYIMLTRIIYGLRNGNWKFYSLHYVNRKISGLRNENWKFYGLHYVNWKNFRFMKWKLEILQFPFHKPNKFPVYITETVNIPVSIWSRILLEFRFMQFPDYSISKMEIFSGKMETLGLMNI